MEKKIRAYEQCLEREAGRKMGSAERESLAKFHQEMVVNFQHERLIHLMVTLFFAFITILSIAMTGWMVFQYGFEVVMLLMYLLTLILVVLTGFYVRHYYFLENHVQGLYKYTEKLRGY